MSSKNKNSNKRKCGVDSAKYGSYALEDHQWSMAPNGAGDDYLYLANLCVNVAGEYWMVREGCNHWIPKKSETDAKRQAKNTWMYKKLPSGQPITSEVISTFFTGELYYEEDVVTIDSKGKTVTKSVQRKQDIGSCPHFQGMMVIPFGPKFLKYEGNLYVNTWVDQMIYGSEENLNLGKAILVMIYRGLCNGLPFTKPNSEPEGSIVGPIECSIAETGEILYQQVLTNQYTNNDFRFVMNWLAAIVQNPGVNLKTNLWFCGAQQGVGKGTLVDIMKKILGAPFVGDVNKAEIEAEWNDHLVGKMLVSFDEFGSGGKWTGSAWNVWIKKNTCEPRLNVRRRNSTAFEVLNIGNYLFTTNEERPMHVELTDRRNQFIKTTDDPYWKAYAGEINTGPLRKEPDNVAAGFAFVLESVKVDFEFIGSAHINEFKREIQDDGDVLGVWLQSDGNITRGTAIRANVFYEFFKDWFKENYPDQKPMSGIKFGREIKKMKQYGVTFDTSDKRLVTFTVGEPEQVQVIDRQAVADNLSELTGSKSVVMDCDVPPSAIVVPAPVTAMEKFRSALKIKMSVREQGPEGEAGN